MPYERVTRLAGDAVASYADPKKPSELVNWSDARNLGDVFANTRRSQQFQELSVTA